MLDAQRFGVDEEPCLSVRHLSKRFGAGCPHCLAPAAQLERNVCPRCGTVHAVRDVSLDVFPAEIVGIVGESGSGKSSLMKCLFFDEEATEGDVRARPFDGGAANLLQLSPQHQRAIRNTVFGMVYQNPYLGLRMDFSSLSNIAEQMIAAGNRNVGAMRVRGEELLARVNIPLSREAEPPRNFSGGMQQRVMIAMAVILHPDLIIADEPTTALDVTIQTQIVELLKDINKSEQNAMLFITHDLNLARRICHKVVVMKDGVVVEADETEKIFMHPKEVYTRNLIEAVPSRLKPRVSVKKESNTTVLTVKDLSVYYEDRSNSIFKKKEKQYAVEHVSFDVYEGESLGLVGESGCGKTSLSKAILGMQEHMSGEVSCHVSRPQMIFQDPYSSLNPSKTIGWLLMEPLRAAGILDKKYQNYS